MSELLSNLLLHLVLLLVGLVPGLERPQPVPVHAKAIDHRSSSTAPVGNDAALVVAPPPARPCSGDGTSTACSGARMRWQVTLLHSPSGRRCADSCNAG